jgi:hypothetical protein
MTDARTLRTATVPFLLAAVAGCAQSGPLLSHQAALGTLKASVSHLEYENQQLRRQVTDLKAENRQIEDRLVQEESVNGELSARLDDARNLLSRRGLGTGDGLDADPTTPGRALPAGRSNRKPRKPPFAQIPGRIDEVPPADDEGTDTRSFEPRSSWRADPGAQSSRNDPNLWLPIARENRGSDSPR